MQRDCNQLDVFGNNIDTCVSASGVTACDTLIFLHWKEVLWLTTKLHLSLSASTCIAGLTGDRKSKKFISRIFVIPCAAFLIYSMFCGVTKARCIVLFVPMTSFALLCCVPKRAEHHRCFRKLFFEELRIAHGLTVNY